MDSFISALCSSLAIDNLWNIFGSIIPFLAISILFGLGNYLIDQILYQISVAGSEDYEDYKYYKQRYKEIENGNYDD